MTKDMFMKCCERMKTASNNIDAVYKLNIDLHEFMDDEHWVVQHLWSVILTPEGYDWFSWFMYEKAYLYELKEDMKAWDENKNEICQTLPDLYNFLVINNHFYTSTK
jgi:predicted protein tyrosine phosphatase